jgi:predicted nucleic acid-binding protein
MAGMVVDCSIVMAWHLGEAQPPSAVALFDRLFDVEGIVPTIWHLEVANALREAARQRRIAGEELDRILADMILMPVGVDTLTSQLAWTRTWKLARRHDLTTYDACYLELAARLDLPLATLDRALATAAAKEGIVVLN